MISATIQGADRLAKLLMDKPKQIDKELKVAVNATAKAIKSEIAKEVGKELKVAQKVIKKTVKVTSSKTAISATVTQKAWQGFPLRFFKPKQNKAGVNYRARKSRGSETIIGGFMGPKPGAVLARWKGNVFKRRGKSRLPIDKQVGPSAIEIFNELGLERRARRSAQERLKKEVEKRIRLVMLRQQGKVK